MFLAAISIFNLILARCVDRRLLFIGANFCTLAVISLFGLRLLVDDPWPDYFWSAGKIVQKILSTHQLDYARRASADLERDFLIFWASGRQRSLETLGILAILAAMDFLNVKIITKRASQARK